MNKAQCLPLHPHHHCVLMDIELALFRYTKSTQNSQLFRIPSHLGIHLVTPKALKILNFSGYPLIWVSISLHQKHSKFSTFQDTLSFGYPCRYTRSTQNPQLFRIPSHLGIHLVTSKALKILIILWCMYSFEFRCRHPGYYDTSPY